MPSEPVQRTAEAILMEACWPSQWTQTADGTLLPILPSPEACRAALVILTEPSDA